MQLSTSQKEIIKHTIKNRLFCGGSKDMDALCDVGYMKFVGRKPFTPDPYYSVTTSGREALNNTR